MQDAVKNKLNPPSLSSLSLKGAIGEQMDTFLYERVLSDFAKHVIYQVTEDKFRLREDDENIVGMWRGEFWGKWVISACRVCRYKKDEKLKAFLLQAALNLIATADENGYIGTYKDPLNVFSPDPEKAVLFTLNGGICGIFKLLRNKYTGVLGFHFECKIEAFLNAEPDIACIMNKHYPCTVMVYKLSALLAYGVGHYYNGFVALYSTYESKSYALVTAGGLNNNGVGLYKSLFFCIADHVVSGSGFDGTAYIETFEFYKDVCASLFAQLIKSDNGRIAHGIKNIVVYHVDILMNLLVFY